MQYGVGLGREEKSAPDFDRVLADAETKGEGGIAMSLVAW